MSATNQPSCEGLPTLPEDLYFLIVAKLDPPSLTNLSLTCKLINIIIKTAVAPRMNHIYEQWILRDMEYEHLLRGVFGLPSSDDQRPTPKTRLHTPSISKGRWTSAPPTHQTYFALRHLQQMGNCMIFHSDYSIIGRRFAHWCEKLHIYKATDPIKPLFLSFWRHLWILTTLMADVEKMDASFSKYSDLVMKDAEPVPKPERFLDQLRTGGLLRVFRCRKMWYRLKQQQPSASESTPWEDGRSTLLTHVNATRNRTWITRKLVTLPPSTVAQLWILADSIARMVPEYKRDVIPTLSVIDWWYNKYQAMSDVE
ncbi:hypothetical protein HK097_008032 [Rhizophlyctis rosea]|uniref:F-box domain-containing protein n=1 Tax=Rhizophlyctis rosea TaxID=64517 RepID=A0AAD5X4T5_9FUNG|nr:hypothetical protein HK097_008032 [Rhizophlyctis rosea]